MKKLIFLILLLGSFAGAQCVANPAGGTKCVGPLITLQPSNPTTVWTFTPSTAQFACPSGAAAAGPWNFCGQNGELEVDYGFGYTSLKGAKGDPGTNGTNGLDGKNGSDGINGTNGLNGKDGINGSNGLNGLDGKSATISVGTVTSGAPPSVSNSGTPTNAVLNFVLQTGPQGPPGLKVGSSGTLILTCQGQPQHSIPIGFSTTCTYSVIK